MKNIKIFDAEMHLMNKIWDEGTIKAIDLANWATDNLGWKKNSTYSMLKKLIEKQAVRRDEPGFVLTPLVSREEIAFEETNLLIEKMFNGNVKMFLTSLISSQNISAEDIEQLKRIVKQSEEK
ncbi:MAG: BlaI/MecI/CopY family transcriptional regulator [Oscillospiraceae bacterium]|nr:BlaI/MecI/CopY family transcriptional regulator [Oscillospiraceae bacterium]